MTQATATDGGGSIRDSMRRRAIGFSGGGFGLLGLGLLVALTAPARPARALDCGVVHGGYEYAGGDAERVARKAAIERTVAALNWMLRGLGRRKLDAGSTIHARFDFDCDGSKVRVVRDGSSTVLTPGDGTPTPWVSPVGEKLVVKQTMTGRRLTQHFHGDHGDRYNTFDWSPDGARLTLHVRITSSYLSTPLDFDLTYQRK